MAFFSFLSWFRPWWKSAETDYESVLIRLTKDINNVQQRLVRVNQRERRTSVTLTLYAILAWLAYALFVWISTSDRRPSMTKGQRLQLWLPVVAGLAFIVSVRTIVRWWFRRVSDGEEKHLRSLQRARRKKIDEIKQATRYDHLRTLLERYDDTAQAGRPGIRRGPSSTLDNRLAPPSKQPLSVPPSTPNNKPIRQQSTQRIPPPNAQGNERQFQGMKDGIPTRGGAAPKAEQGAEEARKDTMREKDQAAAPLTPKSQSNAPPSIITSQGAEGLSFEAPRKQLRFEKTWLDRLADRILGVEPSNQDVVAEQRYALICSVCFSHNGLCPKEEWEEVQYICPRCGTFNSRRPSSVPVTSPWAVSPTFRRASLSASVNRRPSNEASGLSPARSMLELPLPRSPSSKSLLIDSASAPSLLSNGSGHDTEDLNLSAFVDDSREVITSPSRDSLNARATGEDDDTDKDVSAKFEAEAESKNETEAIEELDDDDDVHEEAVRRRSRRGIGTSGREKLEGEGPLRQRHTILHDPSDEPMQVD